MYYDTENDTPYDDTDTPGAYQPDPWGRPWGHEHYGIDPADLEQTDTVDEAPAPAPAPAAPAAPGPTPPPPAPPPPGAPPNSSGGPNLSSLLGNYPGSFTRPDPRMSFDQAVGLLPDIPQFTAPALPTIDPYEAGTYTPTKAEDIYSDPSYTFRLRQGEQAIENSQAAKGLARSMGSLKDLLNYNQGFASQEFGNVDARRRGDFQMNEGNRFNAYQTNTGNKFGLYDRSMGAAKEEYAPKLLSWQTDVLTGQQGVNNDYDRAFKEFTTDYDQWRTSQDDIFQRMKWQSEFDRDNAAL